MIQIQIVDGQEQELAKLKKSKNTKADEQAERAADLREQFDDVCFGRLAHHRILQSGIVDPEKDVQRLVQLKRQIPTELWLQFSSNLARQQVELFDARIRHSRPGHVVRDRVALARTKPARTLLHAKGEHLLLYAVRVRQCQAGSGGRTIDAHARTRVAQEVALTRVYDLLLYAQLEAVLLVIDGARGENEVVQLWRVVSQVLAVAVRKGWLFAKGALHGQIARKTNLQKSVACAWYL